MNETKQNQSVSVTAATAVSPNLVTVDVSKLHTIPAVKVNPQGHDRISPVDYDRLCQVVDGVKFGILGWMTANGSPQATANLQQALEDLHGFEMDAFYDILGANWTP